MSTRCDRFDTHEYTSLTSTNGTTQRSQTGICKRYAGITTNKKCISSEIDGKGLVEIQCLAGAEDIRCSTGPCKHYAGITASKKCISRIEDWQESIAIDAAEVLANTMQA